jgi:CheY-like chemotaxis protein
MYNKQVMLYMDDNDRSRKLLTTILEQNEFDVIAVSDAPEPIRACQNV